MSILSVQRLSYRYPGEGARPPALREISLEVQPGELVVLTGPSGCGKSTLLRAAAGLVPHFHGGDIAGRVIVGGVDTAEHGPGEVAALAGTLFQDPETQLVMSTVRAELAFPLENQGWGPAAVARGVEEAALALGIAQLLERPTSELSGGEMQRVALGAAIAPRPRLLLLDEPTSQLDPVAGDELIAILRRLGEDYETAVVLAEHRLERCLAAADRAVAMIGGQVVCDASPQRFLVWAAREAPQLSTPGARVLTGLGLAPAPGVRGARTELRRAGVDLEAAREQAESTSSAPGRSGAAVSPPAPALRFRRVWHEVRGGPVILRQIDFSLVPGERVALMGHNGAGKSTLLRHAAQLQAPTRGRIERGGRVALLLQNPNHYLVHDRVEAEAAPAALALVGLDVAGYHGRHPRELSGGERQRLALAAVLGDPAAQPPAVVCLDEPTRGMDRGAKEELAELLRRLPGAVIVATHDAEFAAAFARRVVLLAAGSVIADGSPEEILGHGTYFATETARVLPGALLPKDAIQQLRAAPIQVPA